ncbi:MAG: hypothetical protein LC624_06765 [Halobacteriales archaeon]|nr:hypothetical protein [Halobacteriales archaeon]
MFGNRTRIGALLALAVLLLVAPLAVADAPGVRDSPTSFVVNLVDYLVHLVL